MPIRILNPHTIEVIRTEIAKYGPEADKEHWKQTPPLVQSFYSLTGDRQKALRFARRLKLKEDDIIVDNACGDGYIVGELRKKGYRAIGFDIVKHQGAIASPTAIANSEELPLKDGSVRAFINMFGAGYTNMDKTMAGMYRALKPGGKIMLLLHHPDWLENEIRLNAQNQKTTVSAIESEIRKNPSKIIRGNIPEYRLFVNVHESKKAARDYFKSRGFIVRYHKEIGIDYGGGKLNIARYMILEKPKERAIRSASR